MHREFNTPDEMFRRLAFVVYLALLAATAVLGVMALAQGRAGYFFWSATLFLSSHMLRRYGQSRLDFRRFFKSFPFGAPEDEIDRSLRLEIENLIKESAEDTVDWMERQEMRKRLALLVDKDARLLDIYSKEISAIHPTLAAKHRTQGANTT